jgi:hypothetical protein
MLFKRENLRNLREEVDAGLEEECRKESTKPFLLCLS